MTTHCAVHVVPRGDLVAHETEGDDCPCGPRSEPVVLTGGGIGWINVHHSLDGRELSEPIQGRCGNCGAATDQLPCPFCARQARPDTTEEQD